LESAEGLKQLLAESAIPPDSETGLKLASYLRLLEKWNARINLTSNTEWRVIGPMFREGIWASGFYPPGAAAHLDIGSGAGFPALLLKVLIPRVEMDLVESRVKKSQFLETVAQALGLSGVRAHAMRLGDYLGRADEGKRWNCISWKGLKLGSDDFVRLRAHAWKDTQFWMFHGTEPALEAAQAIEKMCELLRRERVPGRRESYLSIYRPA